MTTLNDLVEMEDAEPEMVAEILPADARLSFTAPVSTLVDVFARAAAVSPSKEVVPGTAHALLEVIQATSRQAAHVRVTATDGDQTVSVVSGSVSVHMEGSALLPAKRVHEILKLAPAATAKLEVIGQSLAIRSGRALWGVQVPVGESLNQRLDVSGIEMHSVSAVELSTSLASARVAASSTNARIALMQIQIRNGSVTACDGGRLHRVPIEGLSHDISVTIPVKSVDQIIKALQGAGDEMVSLGYDDSHVVLEVGDDVIVAQRLLLPFPDVEPLILGPTFDNDFSLTVPTEELLSAVRRVRVNSDPDSAAISLNITPGKGDGVIETWVLLVQARDRAGNVSKEAMVCRWSGTKAATVTFNHRYLSEMLALVKEPDVTLKLGADTKTTKAPILIETPEFLGVIQQMAVAF